MNKERILPILFIVGVFLLFVSFVSAQETSPGGGGSQGNSSLGLTISEPSEGAIFVSPNVDISVQVRTDIASHCEFSGQVCNELNECKDIKYKKCLSCDLENSYFTIQGANYDAVPGWDYKIKVTCRSESGDGEIKSVSFSVQGDRNSDTTLPEITIQSPINNVKHDPSNTNLEFEVNELSHCEYTLANLGLLSGSAGHMSIPGYINNFESRLSLSEGNNYSLTLECKDLNENSVSKLISFSTETPASSSGGGGGGDSCARYYTCLDGSEVQYCDLVKIETPSTCVPSNISGAGPLCTPGKITVKCECNEDPPSLCEPSSSAGESDELTKINETPIICDGCLVDEKCVIYGTVYELENKKYYCDLSNKGVLQKEGGEECNNTYECKSNICERGQCGRYCEGCKDENENCLPFGTRLENKKYCDIDKSIKEQKLKEEACNNNYECSSNLCVNNECISQSFIQKIIDWFKRLFGGG